MFEIINKTKVTIKKAIKTKSSKIYPYETAGWGIYEEENTSEKSIGHLRISQRALKQKDVEERPKVKKVMTEEQL